VYLCQYLKLSEGLVQLVRDIIDHGGCAYRVHVGGLLSISH